MKRTPELEVDYAFFSTRRHDEVIWMDFQKNLLLQATSFKNRDALLLYLDHLAECPEIKVIIIHSSLEESGHREYMEFFEQARSPGNLINLKILCNVYSEVIMKLFTLNKIVIHITRNHVIPLFLNVSLACDYRIAAEDTIYENSYLDVGVVPMGGGPFFLSKLLGQGKAYELLVLTRRYTADDALAYGIIDKVVPVAELETEALAIAHQFGNVPEMTLAGLKRVLNFTNADLGRYLEYENRELFRIISHPAFQHRNGAGRMRE